MAKLPAGAMALIATLLDGLATVFGALSAGCKMGAAKCRGAPSA